MMQGPLAPASLMTLQYHIFQSLFIPDHPDPEEKTCPLLLNLIKVYQHYSPPPLGSSGLTNVRIMLHHLRTKVRTFYCSDYLN